MKSASTHLKAAAAALALYMLPAGFSVDDPGQVATAPGPSYLVLEASWDFGDLAPDWRDELTTDPDDTTSRIYLRWREFGHDFATASFQITAQNNSTLDEIPADNLVANDGWRYRLLTVGDLPSADYMKIRVRLRNEEGDYVGDPSNPVVITEAADPDPFLYTPLFVGSIPEIFGVPGIASSVALPGELFGKEWFAGDRRHDQNTPVERGDLWHIGSDTKAMTATLVAILIQEETPLPGGSPVVWDTRLSAVFPEWGGDMHPRFINTTLRHLACHRSGLRMTGAEDAETRMDGPTGPNTDPKTFRRVMTYRLLTRQHTEEIDGNMVVTEPGKGWFYGSGNYLVLGAVIEQLTGRTYEEAMRERLFRPLGMLTAGFGMPVDRGSDQPHGHRREPASPHFAFIDNTRLPPVWNPAGGAFLSLEDWLKFCRLHLTGQQGLLALDQDILDELHTPYPRQFPDQMPNGDDPSYGFGWGIRPQPGNRVLSHDGTYFRFYARVTVHLDRGYAVVTAVNMGLEPYEFGPEATAAMHNHMIAAAENQFKAFVGEPVGGPSRGIMISASGDAGRFEPLIGVQGISGVGGRMLGGTGVAPGALPYLPTTLFFGESAHPILQLRPIERGRLQLRFQTEPRRTYVLEKASNLITPRWVEQGTFTSEGTTAEEFISAIEPSGYYRLRIRR